VSALEILFWVMATTIFYAYIGYGLMLFVAGRVNRHLFPEKKIPCEPSYEPDVTLLVPSYNEETWVERKIRNSFALDYPGEKIHVIWISDGSDDGTTDLINAYPLVKHVHQPERRGKMAAINLGMRHADSEIVIFSDANAMLNPGAIREMVQCFRIPGVGCVCGEKKIHAEARNPGSVAGEGIYWRYESWIKKQESRIGYCIGAIGDLFAVRRKLFRMVREDTINDDFAISMGIALRGYRIAYAPGAWEAETGSADIREEFKRKMRIAAGNMQAIRRMPQLLNPFKYKWLSFGYVSHKFLRSFVAPFCFAALIPVNLMLMHTDRAIYAIFFGLQILFYINAIAGYRLQHRSLAFGIFFIPYYVVMMNLAAIAGYYDYLTGKQTVLWEKVKRKEIFSENHRKRS
jgi:cellulose synthase/poly-beta-1,6-N-acetylglucosamine synthase-like glycosyltransferase